jgi:uncharacterized protein YkwD
MRKLLILLLPIGCFLLIVCSFYLLSSHSHVLQVQAVDAATYKNQIPRRLTLLTPLPTKAPTPTNMPTPTPTSKPIPTPTLTPTPTKIPTPTPTPTKVPSPGTQSLPTDSIQSYIMQKINDYRSSQGLSSVATDSNTCNFAKTRAQEITSNFNHDEFTNRINNHSLPYAAYHEITENIAMTSDYKEVVTMWINSPGHAENMRQNTPYVCVERSGNYYAYEGWRQ